MSLRLFGALLPLLGSVAFASPAVYDITVDTSTIAGTSGSLDFNFNPGPLVSQPASLQILNFTGGTPLSTPVDTGDVTGILPATLTFDNGSPFNDYFQTYTFGSSLSFQVSLFGPALTAPDGMSTSGSSFAFSMFSDAAGTKPVLTSDTSDGFAVKVDVNLDGSTTLSNFLATATPEPGGLTMLGLVIAGGLFYLQRRTAR
jgi:hypothetical protein